MHTKVGLAPSSSSPAAATGQGENPLKSQVRQPQAPQQHIAHNKSVELHTSRSGSLALIISCRFVLSSGPTSRLYCHFSGTKGHFISFASSRRVLKSSGSNAEKVKAQVRIRQAQLPRWSSRPAESIPHPRTLPGPPQAPSQAGRARQPTLTVVCSALQVNGSHWPLKEFLAGSNAAGWLAEREVLLRGRLEET